MRSNDCVNIDRGDCLLADQSQMSQSAARNAVFPPAMDGGNGRFALARYSGSPAEGVENAVGYGVHAHACAIIANTSQAEFAIIEIANIAPGGLMIRMTPADIKGELARRNMSQRDLADAVGMSENHLSKALSGKREFKLKEMDAIRAELAPEPADEDRLPLRSIPILGDVPAGSFEPQEQRGGRRLLVTDPEVPPRAYGLIVKGDSMDLIVPDGATLIIDPDDKMLWPGMRYVVRTDDGETTFKEYQDAPARLVPCSSNPDHKEIALGSEPITIEGRVWSYTMRDIPRRKS